MVTFFNSILDTFGNFCVRFGQSIVNRKKQADIGSEAETVAAAHEEQPAVAATAQEPPVRRLDIQEVSTDPKTDIPPDPYTVNIESIGMPFWEMRDEVNPLRLRQSASANTGDGQGAKPSGDAQTGQGSQGSSPSGMALPKLNIPLPRAKPIPAALRGIIAGGNTNGSSSNPPPSAPASTPPPPTPSAQNPGEGSSPSAPSASDGEFTYRPSWQGPRQM